MHHCCNRSRPREAFGDRDTYIFRPHPRLAAELPTEESQIDQLLRSEALFLHPSFAKQGKRVQDELHVLDYSNPCIISCSHTSSLLTGLRHQCLLGVPKNSHLYLISLSSEPQVVHFSTSACSVPNIKQEQVTLTSLTNFNPAAWTPKLLNKRMPK